MCHCTRFGRGRGLGLAANPIRPLAPRLDRAAFGRRAHPRRAERPQGATPHGKVRERAGVRGERVVGARECRQLVQGAVERWAEHDLGVRVERGLV